MDIDVSAPGTAATGTTGEIAVMSELAPATTPRGEQRGRRIAPTHRSFLGAAAPGAPSGPAAPAHRLLGPRLSG